MSERETKVVPYGEQVPDGWKPLVTLQLPDGRADCARNLAQSSYPLPADHIERHIRSAMALGLPEMKKGEEPHDRTMVLACYGPSLLDTWPLLQNLPPDHDLWTTSGAHSFLVDQGISPKYHTDVDPREHKAWLLRDTCPTTKFYIPSRAHPGFFKKLQDRDVILYHLNVKEERHIVWDVRPKSCLVPCAITAGLCAIQLGRCLGYRKWIIYGMDGSFKSVPGDRPEMHAGPHPNGGEGYQVVEVPPQPHPQSRQFITNMLHLLAIDDFFVIAIQYPIGSFKFVGDGLLPWVEYLSRTDPALTGVGGV